MMLIYLIHNFDYFSCTLDEWCFAYKVMLYTWLVKCGGSTSGLVDRCVNKNSSLCANQRSTPRIGS